MDIDLENGLFDGLLGSLLSQKRHSERYMTLMSEVAKSDPLDQEELTRVVDEAMYSFSRYQKSCAEFIDRFGTRLTLKDE